MSKKEGIKFVVQIIVSIGRHWVLCPVPSSRERV